MKKLQKYFFKFKQIFSKIKNYIEERKKQQSEEYVVVKKNNNYFKEGEEKYTFSFFLKFWFAGFVVGYLSYLIFKSLEILYLIMTAFVISIAMESIIQIFEKILPRGIAIFISYILFFSFLITGFIIIIPFIVNQSAVLINIFVEKIKGFQTLLQEKGLVYVIQNSTRIPKYFKNFLIGLSKNNDFITGLQSLLQENVSELAKLGTNYVKNVGEIAINIVGKFLSVSFQIIFIFIIAIFFSLEKRKVINFIANLGGNKNYIKFKFEELYYKLGSWLKGQILMCLFIGLTVYFALLILSFFNLDLPNKGILALIAGLTEIIPVIGPSLGATPIALIALTQYGFIGFFVIVIFYVIVQFFESHILMPLIMKQALGISALLILIVMTLGGISLGFIGIMLGVPLAVIISLIFEDFIKEEK